MSTNIALDFVILSPVLVWFYCMVRNALRPGPYPCSACGHKPLRSVNWTFGSSLGGDHHIPDSWTSYECDNCGARFRGYANGRLDQVPSFEEAHDFAKPQATP